jgi:hydrogenase maturation protease
MIDILIIGYGNPQRRDDGCGRQVAGRLHARLEAGTHVRVQSVHQLDPALSEDLAGARKVVFVDATIEDLTRGRRWKRVGPETGLLPFVTHHLRPAFLLGLTLSIWGRCPEAWLVSIKGHDFGLGEGLSPQAEEGVEKVSREIVSFVTRKPLTKEKNSSKHMPKARGGLPWPSAQTS